MKQRELGCFQKSRTCWLANFLDSMVGNPEDKPGGFSVQTRFAKGSRQRSYQGKGFFVIEREPLTQVSNENITQAINELKHEVLSHQVFLSCFSSAVSRGEIRGLTKSSLFRTTLAYFLLVPNAKEKFLRELEKQSKRKRT